ncbi:MAG: 6-bladed beta-propeller [Tannerella sp.]|jgi:hypothetical protein|nr:6-bladed beta-propeller [Tannerella sp.]
MKRINTVFVIILLVVTGCGGNKQSADAFITVDVTKSYPKKELILQDFMDVEYIPLETSDDFLTQSLVLAVGEDLIIVKNRVNDGDIFIFDRTTGKGLRKINRKGQGPEEYTSYQWVALDEGVGEMFVNDMPSGRILVYDLEGNFKRSFKHKEGALCVYLYNFDREHLICYDGFFDYDNKGSMHPFFLISKQGGSITKEIQIPFDEKITTLILKDGNAYGGLPEDHYPIISYLDSWILVEPSSDTIYSCLPDQTMKPLIVRTPSVQSMDPEVFLFMSALTDRYYFMVTAKKEYDFTTQKEFPGTNLIYDKQENSIFEYTVYNDDYVDKKRMSIKPSRPRPVNEDIVSWKLLDTYQLVESYKKGELKGELKEIASKLDEESNPVIMLIKHKK